MTNIEENHCLNCQESHTPNAKYCPACGQKVIREIKSIKELLADFFSTAFDINSQLFQTLKALFIPAELSIEYFKGRRKRYLNPFRLFFFITVLLLAVTNFTAKETIEKSLKENSEKFHVDYREEELMAEVDSVAMNFIDRNDYPAANEGIDSLRKELQFLDNDKFGLGFDLLGKIKNKSGKEIELSRRDIFHMTEYEIIKKYEITGLYDRILLSQLLKYYKDGGSFGRFLMSNILWFAFIATLVYALLLKLFFRKQQKYYVEHLVYALYDSCAAFLAMTIAILFTNVSNGYSILIMLPALVFPFLSIKRFYGLGWEESFWKYNFVSFFLLIITGILMFLTFVISFLLF